MGCTGSKNAVNSPDAPDDLDAVKPSTSAPEEAGSMGEIKATLQKLAGLKDINRLVSAYRIMLVCVFRCLVMYGNVTRRS